MDSNITILKKLEYIEHEIRMSYLKDLNKTTELLQLKSILEEILNSNNLEEYFNNLIPDCEYFCKKFTNEVLTNILRQNVIYGENGHETVFSILKLYLQIFLKFYNKPQGNTYYVNLLK